MTDRDHKRFGLTYFVACVRAIAILVGFVAYSSASAEIIVSASIGAGPSYGYGFNNYGPTVSGAGAVTSLFLEGNPNALSDNTKIAIDKVSQIDGGNFYFKSNSYCLGNCYVVTSGITYLTVTNNSDTAANLRFDSQILAGHLGYQSAATSRNSTAASFNFSVSMFRSGDTIGNTLYSATGVANADDFAITTSDGSVFNGLNSYESGAARVFDWSSTNLNLGLGILGAHETIQIQYRTDTLVLAGRTCVEPLCPGIFPCTAASLCDGAQVAFGDPRNSGGVTGVAIVGMPFDVAALRFAVVSADAPLPPQPEPLPPVNYGVPEPTTWAMLIAGFGLAGLSTRRHSRRLSAA